MFVYLLNILLVCVYALLFCQGEKTRLKRAFFIGLCFIQCLNILIMRYYIGTDFYQYIDGFYNMRNSGFSDMKYEDWEIGFILLNKLVGLVTNNDAVFFAVCGVLSLSGIFYMIWRYSENPFLSVFLFLNTYLFYLDMNYVRQGIAMSIMCFAYGFFKDRKLWRFLLLIAVAATFHFFVIYLVPVYFITYIKLNLKTMPIYAAGLVVYFLASDAVLNIVLQHFHKEYYESMFIKYGIAFHYAIYPLVICVAFVALAFYLKFRLSPNLNMLTHLVLMMGFWQIVMTKHTLFERFSYYTMPFMLIAVPEAIKVFGQTLSQRRHEAVRSKLGEDNPELDAALAKSDKTIKIVIIAIQAAVILGAFAYNLQGLIIPPNGAHGVLPFENRYGLNIPNIDGWFKKS